MSGKAAVQYDFEIEGQVVSYDKQMHRGIIESNVGGKIIYYGRTVEKSGLNCQQLKPGTKVVCKVANREKSFPKAKKISLRS